MKARDFLILISSELLAIIGGLFMYFMILLFVSDVFSIYDNTAKLLTLLLLGTSFLVFGSIAASYVAQISMLPLGIVCFIVSAVGSFTLMPTTDVLSVVVAVFISIFSIIIIAGAIQVGKKPVDRYAKSVSVSSNTVYYLLIVEIGIVTVAAFYYILPL